MEIKKYILKVVSYEIIDKILKNICQELNLALDKEFIESADEISINQIIRHLNENSKYKGFWITSDPKKDFILKIYKKDYYEQI